MERNEKEIKTAVALSYDAGDEAPKILATGKGFVAEKIIEAAKEEEDVIRNILEEEMKGAASLAVTLEVDIHSGTDWYEAK